MQKNQERATWMGNASDQPEMTSKSSISFRPFLKSSSMFSIWVPAFLRWELHQAVKVCNENHAQLSTAPLAGRPLSRDNMRHLTHSGESKTLELLGS